MGDISKNFSRKEFVCKCGCGFDTVDAELITVLEDVRAKFYGERVFISSGSRCRKHNNNVRGSASSQHLLGKAADIVIMKIPAYLVADYLEEKYPDKYGIGRYRGFTHIDVRGEKARWSQ